MGHPVLYLDSESDLHTPMLSLTCSASWASSAWALDRCLQTDSHLSPPCERPPPPLPLLVAVRVPQSPLAQVHRRQGEERRQQSSGKEISSVAYCLRFGYNYQRITD